MPPFLISCGCFMTAGSRPQGRWLFPGTPGFYGKGGTPRSGSRRVCGNVQE